MATSRSAARRARRAGTTEESVGVSGTSAAPKFRQSLDASAGTTAVVWGKQRFASFDELYKAHPEAKEHAVGKGGATVKAGSDRAEMWPEMHAPAPEVDHDEEEGEDGAEPKAEGDGYTAADLEPLSDQELSDLADARGIQVKGRGRKKATRDDYLAQLEGQ